MIRHVVNRVVGNDVPVACPQEHAGNEIQDNASVVDVIIHHLVKHWMKRTVPDQHNGIRSGIGDFIALDDVAIIVSFQIDCISADLVEIAVLDRAMARTAQMHCFSAVCPAELGKHGAVAIQAISVKVITRGGVRESNARQCDPLGVADAQEAVQRRYNNIAILHCTAWGPEVEQSF